MSSSLGSLVPMVTSFHWDDLTNQFRLKISFELKTPLGNFFREEVFTLADLAAVVAEIYNILTGAASIAPGYVLEYNLGDWPALATHVAAHAPSTITIPEPITPEDVPRVPDGGAWAFYLGDDHDGGVWGSGPP